MQSFSLPLALDLQSEASYTISSDGQKNTLYSEILGRYNLVASHYRHAKTPIYKHENKSFYLLNTFGNPNSHQEPRWVVGNTSQMILKSTEYYSQDNISDPRNIWYFSAETSRGIESWFEDTTIKVSPSSPSSKSTNNLTLSKYLDLDCKMGQWISGECSKTCGRGIRNVQIPPVLLPSPLVSAQCSPLTLASCLTPRAKKEMSVAPLINTRAPFAPDKVYNNGI